MRDALTGREVVIVGRRQSRPNLPADGCPFCVGGLEAPDPYGVRNFVNRWPPMDGDRCEVVLYTAQHDASFASLTLDHATSVVDMWAARTAALGERADVAYVLIFENRGAEVGATIAHPHGQIYAFDHVPDAPARELDAKTCALCHPVDHGLTVATTGGWHAWVPAEAEWPFELRLAPNHHVGGLTDAGADHRDLAELLTDVVGRLDRLFDAPMPYMLWLHQRPVDGGEWPNAHLHVHIAPLLRAPGTPRFVAAGELGSGTYFNPVDPGDAAQRLRDA